MAAELLLAMDLVRILVGDHAGEEGTVVGAYATGELVAVYTRSDGQPRLFARDQLELVCRAHRRLGALPPDLRDARRVLVDCAAAGIAPSAVADRVSAVARQLDWPRRRALELVLQLDALGVTPLPEPRRATPRPGYAPLGIAVDTPAAVG